ncbi:murein L,D-transpeptidase [Brevirhabdus pacifica]|uniref:Murein L,D-transpeptidase n=1 Tax=Brevirhabdus pacifica TaxID=1267768 RepID=A0A1U7DLX4_9RHOB|nr:murein L,D-transpeptidase [Brevirhabdus pacifica]OWU80360.1 peptidoglycan-binding protein [Loktanella sp. 22II-4b]
MTATAAVAAPAATTPAPEANAGPSMAFKQALAEAAAQSEALAAFYRERDYQPIWTGEGDAERRSALFSALAQAAEHGLPVERYDTAPLAAQFRAVRSERERGKAEVAASLLFLRYAKDVQTGVLTPGKVDSGVVRKVLLRDPLETMRGFAEGSPRAFLRKLPPQNPEYAQLLKERRRLAEAAAQGGWGPQVPVSVLRPGTGGPSVVALRNRLIRMGYMKKTPAVDYDVTLQKAVQRFQRDHGLTDDGVAGPATLGQLNIEPDRRLRQVLVALERRRWLNQPLGKRHILVNLADFRTYVVDDGKVSFETVSVVGKNTSDRRTPEFSDEMTHMVINPTWNVPRSIATKEYLPMLKRNPNAVSYLKLYDGRGREVNRSRVDFTQLTETNFPFDMKQPPSPRNALGRVKFMFPNRYAIYLHDTPAKSLFSRSKRDFSHGCVRLEKPFDFAYHLLAPQIEDEEGYFNRILRTGRETQVNLDTPLPVHLVYRTAWVPAGGRVNFRPDVYDRDDLIFDALLKAGVALGSIES